MIQALREILAVFKVDNTSLKKGLTEGNKLVDGLKDALGALTGPLTAALSGGAIVAFAHDLIEGADAASKMADSLGLGIVELQGWQHAADMSGVASEQLSVAFTKLQHGLAEVADKGKGPAAEALEALGIEAKSAEGKLKSSSAVLEEVADAIQGLDADARNAQLMKLFGEQGAKLVPLLKGGSAGVRALRSEVEELGFAFDDGFAASAEEFNDNLTRVKRAGQGLLLQVLGPIMPELVHLSSELIKAAKSAMPLVKQVIEFTRNSNLLQASIAMLAGKGLVMGVTQFGKLASIIKVATSAALRFLLPLVAIDDLVGFLAGDNSLTGLKLDEWFGAGTADKVRDSIKELAATVVEFVDYMKTEAGPILEEWGPRVLRFGAVLAAAAVGFKLVTGAMALWSIGTKVATGAMALFNAIMLANPVTLVAAAIIGALALIVAFWPEISGFFTGLWEHVKVIGGNIADFLSGVWTEIKFGALGLAATLSDAFAGMWNGIVSGAQWALRTVAGLVSKIPVIGGSAADGLKELADGAGGFKMNTDASDVVAKQLQDARRVITDELAAKTETQRLAAAPNTSYYTNDVQQTTTVQVTVPPGTPETLADRVGAAAARGAREGSGRNNRATLDALVPRPAG